VSNSLGQLVTQPTRHTVKSSNGQLITTVNSSHETSWWFEELTGSLQTCRATYNNTNDNVEDQRLQHRGSHPQRSNRKMQFNRHKYLIE